MTASDHYVGTWGSDAVYNQSLNGLGQRWCTTQWNWLATDCTVGLALPSSLRKRCAFGIYAIELSLLATVLWICGRPFRKLGNDYCGELNALECSMILLLMVLLSPMSSKAHFGTLVLPGFCFSAASVRTA